MKGEIFLSAGILHAHRDGDARRLHRAGSEDGKLLEHDFQIGIVLEQREHVGQRPFAVAATVIEELDQRDRAVRIAERDLVRRGEKRAGIVRHRGTALVGAFECRRRSARRRSRSPPAGA